MAKRTTFILLAAFIFLCLQAQNKQRRLRPVLFNTDTAFVHDPVMAYENGIYYMFYTGHNIGFATSKDCKTWTVHRDGVLRDIPRWTHDSVPGFKNHIWAPDIIQWHGRWWMAYSCSTFGKNTSAIGLLSCSSLEKADWKDMGCLVASHGERDNWNAIDPNFIEDEQGNLWMTWGSFWDGIQQASLAVTHTPDGQETLCMASSPRTIARRYYKNEPQGFQNPTSKYAGLNAIEAPFIFRHGEYYYLFASWDYCCQGMKSTYHVVVGRSRHIDGPYLDRDGKPMSEGGGTPVIQGDKKEYEAVGHCAAYHFLDEDLFICHGYSIALQGQPVLIQKPIRWENDWPVIE
ncbi:MAG: family 43 glycosylhydrolase [Prevotella sp.]|nr:family 43 glycosylhydrolase [Prevotella sp.]